MKILLTGATGLIGTALCKRLLAQGHELVILTRSDIVSTLPKMTYFKFDYLKDDLPFSLLENLEGVINLAGEDLVSSRWNSRKKALIKSSRIDYTRKLVHILNHQLTRPLKFFISTSAIGYYPQRKNNNKFDEDSIAGDDFLASVCKDWEKAAHEIKATESLMIIRLGVVLGKGGGCLKKAVPLFLNGLGGKLGNGKQIMSWIHLDDLISAIEFLMKNKMAGVYNLTAPKPVTNAEFTKELAHVLHRPSVMIAPKFLLKLMAGEVSSVLMSDQNVFPKKLLELGFKFQYGDLSLALENILSSSPSAL